MLLGGADGLEAQEEVVAEGVEIGGLLVGEKVAIGAQAVDEPVAAGYVLTGRGTGARCFLVRWRGSR